MSHEIGKSDTGWMFHKPAWHRLFDVGQTRPKTIAQARKVSGLTWEVETVEFITIPTLEQVVKTRKGTLTARDVRAIAGEHAAPRHRAIVRTDTGAVLGTASDEYEPITNKIGFEVMEAVLGETRFEALFSMRDGRNVCLLSEFPEWITVGGDKVRQFLYGRLDHSGAGAMIWLPTNVRVQCANTDRMAVSEAGDGIFRIRHIGNVTDAVAQVRAGLKLQVDYSKQFKKLGDRLAKQSIAEKQLQKVLAELYPSGSDDSTRTRNNVEKTRETITRIFLGEGKFDTRGNAPGSKWAAYNAVTEYVQHYAPVRSKDATVAAERRFVRGVEDPTGIQRKALELLVG